MPEQDKLYASCDPSWFSQVKEYRKTKSIHSYSLWLLYLKADWYILKRCRLTIFVWAPVPILDFLDQQEKFTTCVTKLTLAAKVAFIHKILALFVDRMHENRGLHECEPRFPPPG